MDNSTLLLYVCFFTKNEKDNSTLLVDPCLHTDCVAAAEHAAISME